MRAAMSDVLVRIKRAVLAGRFEFSRKAADEMDAYNLTRLDVAESIVNAVAIYKTIRSRSRSETGVGRPYMLSRAPICGGFRSIRKENWLPRRASRHIISWYLPNEPNENHDLPENMSNLRKQANPARAKKCHAKEPRQAIHGAASHFSRVPGLRRTGLQPRSDGKNRNASAEARPSCRLVRQMET